MIPAAFMLWLAIGVAVSGLRRALPMALVLGIIAAAYWAAKTT